MKNTKLPLLFVGALLVVSCSTYNHSHRVAEIPQRNLEIADKIVVDIDVDLTKTVKARSNKHSSVKDAKDEAYYRAIVDNNIHVLVDPIYSIETSSKVLFFGGKSVAEITGFAGYYKNPRQGAIVEQQKFDQDLLNLKKLDGVKLGGKEAYTVDTKCCGEGKGTGGSSTTLLYKEEKSAVEIYNQIKGSGASENTGSSGSSSALDNMPGKIKGLFKKKK